MHVSQGQADLREQHSRLALRVMLYLLDVPEHLSARQKLQHQHQDVRVLVLPQEANDIRVLALNQRHHFAPKNVPVLALKARPPPEHNLQSHLHSGLLVPPHHHLAEGALANFLQHLVVAARRGVIPCRPLGPGQATRPCLPLPVVLPQPPLSAAQPTTAAPHSEQTSARFRAVGPLARKVRRKGSGRALRSRVVTRSGTRFGRYQCARGVHELETAARVDIPDPAGLFPIYIICD
mmetsp:Transcript_13205/g.37231  ORF Transcript_13205/g.37231 Transcript_13205/m.37231 type:complete len:236 (-) Transcript_13205:50-757(-)